MDMQETFSFNGVKRRMKGASELLDVARVGRDYIYVPEAFCSPVGQTLNLSTERKTFRFKDEMLLFIKANGPHRAAGGPGLRGVIRRKYRISFSEPPLLGQDGSESKGGGGKPRIFVQGKTQHPFGFVKPPDPGKRYPIFMQESEVVRLRKASHLIEQRCRNVRLL